VPRTERDLLSSWSGSTSERFRSRTCDARRTDDDTRCTASANTVPEAFVIAGNAALVRVVQLLSNDRYHVMVTSAGGGYSSWRHLAITRWREDGTCDNSGSFCYLRDRASGDTWSPTGVRATRSFDHDFQRRLHPSARAERARPVGDGPRERDRSQAKLSVLATVGTALLGVAVGTSVTWRYRSAIGHSLPRRAHGCRQRPEPWNGVFLLLFSDRVQHRHCRSS
jgi:hypothetical protein